MKKIRLIILFGCFLLALAACRDGATLSPTTSPIQETPPRIEQTSASVVEPPTTEIPLPAVLEGDYSGAENLATRTACRAFGWLVDANRPEDDLTIRVVVDGSEVAQAVAGEYRPDLEAEGKCPGGTCAFSVDLWELVSPQEEHTVAIEYLDPAQDRWLPLSGSPRKLTCTAGGAAGSIPGEPQISSDPSGRSLFQVGQYHLIVEFLDDDLVHFELGASAPERDLSVPIISTPMVAKTDYPGPSRLEMDGQGRFETSELKIEVDPATLCLKATDKTRQPQLVLTTLCPRSLGSFNQGISLTPETFTHAYGLGQEFITPGSSEGDWIGRVRGPGGPMGNAMIGWNGGAVGNTQFPVLYLAGKNLDSYALFADNAYRQRWDFTRSPWTAEIGGSWMRFYLMSGPNLQDLRKDYLELVGHPPVPPKKMFGLWISEYGFDQWAELENKLLSLRANRFPVDGFVLDLQWFGGIQRDSDNTRMGSLTWDLSRFPDPAAKIAWLREEQGVGILTIEESYIGKNLPEHADLESRGFLAQECAGCPAIYLTGNPWWGKGGMMDWTNTAGRDYWHDTKREALIEDGVIGHWTDLGEPEMYDPGAWYSGIPGDLSELHAHADIHNLYNLLWSRGIFEGYLRNRSLQRPFILSRSGAPGSQRYGVAMWSGDIGSNLSSLATHLNAQMHMSMSGVDYYGSDIGGFHRESLDGDLNELYTQWFANGMMFDIPGRAHTENLCNCKETAPDRIGSLQSNLANTRLRYELSPYLYSLSHRAYRYAEPIFPPLVYYYQGDPEVREMGHEKMIGRDLLVGIVAGYGETERGMYLPAGVWVNFATNEILRSKGEWLEAVPTMVNGVFRLPMFARAGAILPLMYVDEKTMNITGQRSDGSVRDELIVQVYAGDAGGEFTLYEDDGETTAYQSGAVRTTLLSQQPDREAVRVTIAAAEGSYTGAPESRDNVVRLVSQDSGGITGVSLNGSDLPELGSLAEWETAASGWFSAGNNLVLAKSGRLPVGEQKVFEFRR